MKIDLKIQLIFGIDFGPLFLTFGSQNGSQTAPKSSQNDPNDGTIIDTGGCWKRPGTKMVQNGPKGSKSTPKTTPGAPKPTPKRPPELQKRRCPSHVALCTLHFQLRLCHQYSPAVCAKRLNKETDADSACATRCRQTRSTKRGAKA